MAPITPTVRERRVFAALMAKFIDEPSLAGSSVSQTDLDNALHWFNEETNRLAVEEAAEQAAIDEELSQMDIRG